MLYGRSTECTLLLQVGKVLRDMSVQQVSLYWQVKQKVSTESSSGNLSESTWQHVEHPADLLPPSAVQPQDCSQSKPAASSRVSDSDADLSPPDTLASSAQPTCEADAATASHRGTTALEVAAKPADAHTTAQASDPDVLLDALVLHPMSCVVRVASLADKRTGMTRLNTLFAIEKLDLSITQLQLCDMVRLTDMFAVWQLHNRYALLRPTGWRSDPDGVKFPARSAM